MSLSVRNRLAACLSRLIIDHGVRATFSSDRHPAFRPYTTASATTGYSPSDDVCIWIRVGGFHSRQCNIAYCGALSYTLATFVSQDIWATTTLNPRLSSTSSQYMYNAAKLGVTPLRITLPGDPMFLDLDSEHVLEAIAHATVDFIKVGGADHA